MRPRSPLALVLGGTAYAAPVVMAAADVALATYRSVPGLALQRVAFTLFVPALIGAAVVADGRPRLGVIGAGLAALAAAAMAVVPTMLVSPTRPPAVLFPAGLLVMAAAFVGAATSRRLGVFVFVAALLFPVAHVTGSGAALLASDLLLGITLWTLAPRITGW